MLVTVMLAKRAPTSAGRLEPAAKPVWSTTATEDFDATAAANNETAALGDHAAACSSASPLRAIVDALHAVHHALRPRMITLLLGVLLTAIVAALILG